MYRGTFGVLLAAGQIWLAAGFVGAQAMASDSAPVVIEVAARPILYVSSHAPAGDGAAAGQALGVAYAKVLGAMGPMGVEENGPPLAINRAFDPKGEWVFDAAIPVKTATSSPFTDAEVKAGATPSGRVVKVVHTGPYAGMHSAYDAIEAFIKANNLKPGGVSWEEYVSDPGSTAQDALITNVYFQIAAP